MGKGPSPAKAAAKGGPADALLTKRKAEVEKWAELPHIAKIKPYLLTYSTQIATAMVFGEEKAMPFIGLCIMYAMKLWETAQPYLTGKNTEDLVPAICGFVLCFFGGTFPLCIAAVEAFRLAGWKGMKKAIIDLKVEGEKALDAHKKDETEDKDGDGIPDSKQCSPQALVMRKSMLFLKVVDPDKVSAAAACLSCGLLAVLASLKMSFARAITLGATLGDVAKKAIDARVMPQLTELCPLEYRKWLPNVVEFVTKFIAVSIAFMLQAIISAFHSAIRGGRMLGKGGVNYANRMGWIKFNDEESLLDETAGWTAAAVGFMFQLYMGFGLPFPTNVIFMPFSLLEWSLSVAIQWF